MGLQIKAFKPRKISYLNVQNAFCDIVGQEISQNSARCDTSMKLSGNYL
jgi:hypothetical protein